MRMRAALAAALLALGASPAGAHPLDLGTARITLRDDHVEVQAEVDLFLLIGSGPTAIAVGPEPAVEAEVARLQRILESETRLFVDGEAVPLSLRGLPGAAELRALAATLSAAQKDHGELVRLRFEALRPLPGAKRVEITLPPALGPILVSFVQPATRFARPGERAAFDVLGRPANHCRSGARSGLLAVALLMSLGGAIVAVAVLIRRRFPVLA